MKISPERLALTHELHALVIDYWHDVDTNWGRNAPDYYTEDGVFEGPAASYAGREKIRAFYKWREDRGARTVVHAVHNFQALLEGARQGDLPLVPDALRRRRQAGAADAPADPDRVHDRPPRARRDGGWLLTLPQVRDVVRRRHADHQSQSRRQVSARGLAA